MTFMGKMLDLTSCAAGTGYLVYLSQQDKVRQNSSSASLSISRVQRREEFKQMTGLASRSADRAIAAL
jgi:hypothetical protein